MCCLYPYHLLTIQYHFLDHPYWHGFERKYANLSSDIMPLSESLQDTIDRTTPLWDTNIVTDLKAGKNVMIMAHRNSIKGILKLIDGISNEDLQQVCCSYVALWFLSSSSVFVSYASDFHELLKSSTAPV